MVVRLCLKIHFCLKHFSFSLVLHCNVEQKLEFARKFQEKPLVVPQEAMDCLREDRQPVQEENDLEAMEELQEVMEADSSILAPSKVPILHVNPLPQTLIWDRMSVTIANHQV